MIEHRSDLQIVLRHIRLSRLKLGSVLDRLESFEPGREALERLRDHADAIAYEIDSLVELARRLHDA